MKYASSGLYLISQIYPMLHPLAMCPKQRKSNLCQVWRPLCGGICDIAVGEVCYDPVVPRQEDVHLELPEPYQGFLVLGSTGAVQIKTTDGIIRVYYVAGNEDLTLAIV